MTTTSPPPRPRAETPRGSVRPALDPKRLRELQALKPAVRSRVLDAYRRDAPAVMAAIEAALELGDPKGARDGAHRLKSSSAAMGATELAELFGELEIIARIGVLVDASSLVLELRTELSRVLQGLENVDAG